MEQNKPGRRNPKTRKAAWPRPSNVLYSELIMYLVTGRFTVTLIIHRWSTKIGIIDIFASYKPFENETRKSNSAIDMVTDNDAPGKFVTGDPDLKQ